MGSRPHKCELSDPGNGGDCPLPEQSESQLMRRRGLVVRSQVAGGCGETARTVGAQLAGDQGDGAETVQPCV